MYICVGVNGLRYHVILSITDHQKVDIFNGLIST
jgi:hypothetical protein